MTALPHLHLLPGLHGTPELFRPLLDVLGDRPYSTTHYADDPGVTAESVLRQIEATVPTDRPYVLLGESFSGMFATLYAARRPPNLLGLVLVNTFLKLPLAPVINGFAQARLRLPWPVARQLLLDRHADQRLVKLTKRVVKPLPTELVAARFGLLARTDARPAGRDLTLPTLMLHGANDVFVMPYNSRRIARVIPGSARKRLPGPHLLLQTHPVQSLAAIDQWWSEEASTQGRHAQQAGADTARPRT